MIQKKARIKLKKRMLHPKSRCKATRSRGPTRVTSFLFCLWRKISLFFSKAPFQEAPCRWSFLKIWVLSGVPIAFGRRPPVQLTKAEEIREIPEFEMESKMILIIAYWTLHEITSSHSSQCVTQFLHWPKNGLSRSITFVPWSTAEFRSVAQRCPTTAFLLGICVTTCASAGHSDAYIGYTYLPDKCAQIKTQKERRLNSAKFFTT